MNHAADSKARADALRTSLSEEDVLRVHTYGLLGSLLAKPPHQELLGMLAAIEPNTSAGEENTMAEAWHALATASREATTEAVNDEFHDLFIGLGRGELMPFGSWYRTGYLMERPLAYLRRDLERLGIARQEEVKEPEDHAGALLEIMKVMISSNIGEHEQQRFFNTHIEPWMARFFHDITGAASARFYRAVGVFGERFIAIEKQYLSMLPH